MRTRLQFRFLWSFLYAGLASLGLFWLMHFVTGGSGKNVDKLDVLAAIDFVRLKKDTEVENIERRKPPPPPPPKEPPPPPKLKVASETPQESPAPFDIPNLGLSANVGGGPFLGAITGGGGGAGAGLFDGDIILIAGVEPQYPRTAARDQIEGTVMLEVTVNPDGTVRSAKVIQAKPRGVFEAAAIQAVLKWKFKPKVVNGQPVAQVGKQLLEFNLNDE